MTDQTPEQVAAAAAAAGTADWRTGLDADLLGHVANRGWDKLKADEVAQQAVKAHREAEKLIGVPAEQVLRLPKDANDKDGFARIFKALGVPEDPKTYDFTGVKTEAGIVIAPELAEKVRGIAATLHLPPAAAIDMAKAVLAIQTEGPAKAVAEYAVKLAQEKDALAKNWGANAGVNKIVAENAAQKLGVTVEEIKALESSVGYARVMEMFRNIGARIGEDKFVNQGQGGGNNAMTAEQAQAKLDALGRDAEWMKRYDAGDVTAMAEFDNLTKLVTAARMGR